MDDYGKYEYWELPYFVEWGRKVSGLKNLEIRQLIRCQYYAWALAWCVPNEKTIYLNGDLFLTYDFIERGWLKSVILHEIGHVFSKKYRTSAKREYKAHEWAMKKCVKLGMENQLWYLKRKAEDFGLPYIRNHGSNTYYIAYKWFKRKSII